MTPSRLNHCLLSLAPHPARGEPSASIARPTPRAHHPGSGTTAGTTARAVTAAPSSASPGLAQPDPAVSLPWAFCQGHCQAPAVTQFPTWNGWPARQGVGHGVNPLTGGTASVSPHLILRCPMAAPSLRTGQESCSSVPGLDGDPVPQSQGWVRVQPGPPIPGWGQGQQWGPGGLQGKCSNYNH